MSWLLPAMAAMSMLGLVNVGNRAAAGKRQYKADRAMYEEQLRAKKWQEIEALLRGGLGSSYPLTPPQRPSGGGLFDYLSAFLPALQMYAMFQQPSAPTPTKGTGMNLGGGWGVTPGE